MDLSTKTLTTLVFVSLGFSLLVLLALAASAGRRRRREAAAPTRMDEEVRAAFDAHARSIARLEAAVRQLAAASRRLDGLVQEAVRHVGIVRYDAFEDVGGQLSFSCALLDDHGDGVVITSINGRQETRVYAKPISEGVSLYNLSAEEEEAIRRALEEHREAVKAR